jgi:hypothetical protein
MPSISLSLPIQALWVLAVALAAGLSACSSTSRTPAVIGEPRVDGTSWITPEPPVSRTPRPEPAADDDELALMLSNPIAALINVPIQGNRDTGIGSADADRTTINVQPVIPFSMNPDWNAISRTIVPIIEAESPVAGGEDESGLGDVLQSFFFSPKEPTESGWIWGMGPALLFPTASDDALGGEKWAAGPTLVVLRQANGWTYGALANHLWSYAGDDDRADVNATFVQPFLTYTTKTHTTLSLNTESTYAWNQNQWTVPINATVSQLLKLGKLPISLGAGYREYVEAPDGGPDWGLRVVLTFLFPS